MTARPSKKTAAKKTAAPAKKTTINAGKTCSERGCDRDAYSAGLCRPHWTKQYRSNPVIAAKAALASAKSRAKRQGKDVNPDLVAKLEAIIADGATPSEPAPRRASKKATTRKTTARTRELVAA
jgi:hypothetical protein